MLLMERERGPRLEPRMERDREPVGYLPSRGGYPDPMDMLPSRRGGLPPPELLDRRPPPLAGRSGGRDQPVRGSSGGGAANGSRRQQQAGGSQQQPAAGSPGPTPSPGQVRSLRVAVLDQGELAGLARDSDTPCFFYEDPQVGCCWCCPSWVLLLALRLSCDPGSSVMSLCVCAGSSAVAKLCPGWQHSNDLQLCEVCGA
jgi:hypothetical protein